GGYSFESSCGADASVNALTSASARSSIDVDGATNDWFLEENNTINWSVNTRSVNTTGTRVVNKQARGIAPEFACKPGRGALCLGPNNYVDRNSDYALDEAIAIGSYTELENIRPDRDRFGYDPRTNNIPANDRNGWWKGNRVEVGVGNEKKGVTRQITGVAAGSEMSDIINVAQLKKFRQWREEEIWKITVDAWDYSNKFFGVGSTRPLNIDGVDGFDLSMVGTTVSVGLDHITQRKGTISIENTNISLSNSELNLGNKKIINVMSSSTDLSDKSTDAVTGGQLHSVKLSVDKFDGVPEGVRDDSLRVSNSINLSLGGGADILKDKQPKYRIQSKDHVGIEAAFKGVDSELTELFKKVESSGERLVQRDKQSNRFTIGGNVKGNEVSIVNKEGKFRVLTGLKDGTLSDESTDAVTGNQFYKTDQDVEKLTSSVKGVQDNVIKINTTMNATLAFGTNISEGKLPTYTIQGQKYQGVEAAFGAVDKNLTGLYEKVEPIEGHGFVEQDEASKDITIGKKIEGDEIVIAGIKGAPRIFSGVSDGEIKKSSTDAVNGAQLYKLGSDVSQYLGGDANVLEGKEPKYTIQTKLHNDIASAFKGVDTSLTQLSGRVGNITGIISNSLVLQDESHKITIGGKVDGDEISIAGNKGVRKLTNLEDGKLSKDSKDAVTGGQLHDVKQSAEKLTSSVESVQQNITKFNENITKSLGGGANVLEDIAPKYSIQDDTHNDIASAFKGVGDTLTVLSGKVGDLEKNSLVEQDESGLITIGKNVEGGEISIANKTKGLRKLTGLEKGIVDVGSTDAVTGGQLYDVEQSVEKLSNSAESVQANVVKLDTNINASLGGDANVLQSKVPTYTIQDQERTSIEDAFAGVDEKLTSLLSDVKEATSAISNSLVEQDLS
ncbi:autotransporter adhesin, partial [Bartonella chomelii]|nr:autotransporter adhesin [Bartonella chomelii]